MKRIIVILIIITFFIGLKFLFFSGKDKQKQAGNTSKGNVPLSVTAFVVKGEKMQNKLFVTGTIMANEEVELVPEISGKILSINIKEGGIALKGEQLVKINDADFQAQLKKLKAQEKLAKDRESRQRKLLELNGISIEEHEMSLNSLESIQADIEFTKAQIAKTEIRAPFSGIVGLRNVSEGAYVSSTAKIASLQQVDPVKIEFSVPEKYASSIYNGNTIRFSVDGSGGTYEGKIIAVEPKIDIATRTMKVKAVCPNKLNKILPGSFAKIEILLKESENSLMVPTEALVSVIKGYKLFLYRNGKVQEAKVLTGLRTENLVQVIDGLHDGDTIITSGTMQIKNGSPVKISFLK